MSSGVKSVVLQVGAIVGAIGFILLLTLVMGASPVQVMLALWDGAFGTPDRIARCFSTLVPLVLCACGLIFTFTAGLYNLGIEGQMIMGAIATTFALRVGETLVPPVILLPLAIVTGGLGGAVWGWCTGMLNVYGRINEIFAGLGLNFIAEGLALYLVFGPWQREGVASMSGTEPFADALHLGTIGTTEASPVALAIAIVTLITTILVIRGTYVGLRLRAVGQNLRAAYILGIPSVQYLIGSFVICGALAGIAGSLQVLAVFHRLIPGISSNLGFLALLIVMLVNYNPLFVLPVAFFFSSLNVGSLQLPLALNLESSLSGVIQGVLVLFVLLGRGLGQSQRIGTRHVP